VRVIAIIAAYNEKRFIAASLENLFRQGVEAYLIDNSSTDQTIAIAQRYLGRGLIGIESFPRPKGMYSWQPLLKRKEQLAATLDADWFMHVDADEIRLPPRSDQTLAEAFAEAQARGYNAINFLEFTFIPTREAPDHDHPEFQRTMRWYYPFLPKSQNQVKAWRRSSGPVDLAWSGGHRVRFNGVKVYPLTFPMRHYLFLSVSHLIEKYVEKIYDPTEVRRGWHGWRNRINLERVTLPSQAELRVYTADDELDPSSPRRKHFIEEHASTRSVLTPVARAWQKRFPVSCI